jgi:hypothetical protein
MNWDDKEVIAKVKKGTTIGQQGLYKLMKGNLELGRILTEEESALCLDGLPLKTIDTVEEDCKFTIEVGSVEDSDEFDDKDTIHLTIDKLSE